MDINIKDAAQNANGTATLFLATSFFLQIVSTRFTAIFDRYHMIAGDYRDRELSEERRTALRDQIKAYRERSRALKLAGQWLLTAEFFLIVAILSVLWASGVESLKFLRPIFIVSSSIALVFLFAGAVCAYKENALAGHGIDDEIKDLKDL